MSDRKFNLLREISTKLRNITGMKIKASQFLLIISIAASTTAMSDQVATTQDGRKVRLSNDGTYSFITEQTKDYKKLDFSDFMLDAEYLVGERVKVRGDVGFYNNSGKKYPKGSIYQEFSTIGPSITLYTENLSRDDLKKIHSKCSLSCNMEISGKVKKTKYTSQYIDAESIKLLNRL